jgi:hypothetical protein
MELFLYQAILLSPSSSTYPHLRISQSKKHLRHSLNIFISKWLSNTLATGLVMQRRQHRVFNRCPRCNHWGEDRLHIVICWDVRATIVWKKQIDTLTNLLHQEYTAPEIQQFLLAGLQEFRKHPRQNSPEPPLWKTETSQIGWLSYNFV